MKKHLIPVLVALFLLVFLCSCDTKKGEDSVATTDSQAQVTQGDEKITVLTPLGSPPNIKLKSMAPRKGTLEGKTVYIVDNIYPGSDLLLTEMEAWFKREMPKTKAIYKRKQAATGGFEGEDPALWAEIKEKADAVIIGLGH